MYEAAYKLAKAPEQQVSLGHALFGAYLRSRNGPQLKAVRTHQTALLTRTSAN